MGRSDHLAPLFCLLDDNLVEFSRRARERRCAQVSEPRHNLGVDEPRIDLLVELVDDFGWGVPRSCNPNPRAGLEACWNSASVGISGNACQRVALMTARARSLPVLMCSIDAGRLSTAA